MTEPEVLHPLRPFLKNWLWEHGRIGTRFLNVRSGELGFDEGKKARFASEPMVYVPLVSHLEDEAPRTAPLVHEAELTQFLRAAQLGKPEEAGTALQVQRAAQDCVELALMCAYQGAAQRAHAKFSQEALFEDEIRAEVVTEVRKLYVGLREQLALYDYTVFHGLPSPLLLGDSPFIDWRVRAKPPMPFVSIPLGPYCLLVGTPSNKTSRAGPVAWKSVVAMGPFKDHNRHLVDAARHWLVATSDEQLAALQPRFAPPEAPKPPAAPAAPA